MRQNQGSDHQKQLRPSKSSDSESVQRIQQLETQLATFQVIERELAETKASLQAKIQALETTNAELAEKTQTLIAIKSNFAAKNKEFSNLKEEFELIKSESQKNLQEKTEQIIALEVELKETKNVLATIEEKYSTKLQNKQTTIDGLQAERESYLTQIAKLQEVINQTEEEIKEIEASHLEIQDQLSLEIKRTEERAGQMREDLTRETRGTLARDRHIRVVLQQTELGRILLFLVDYFENTKKRSLALGTLSTEVGIPPIICRTHLRHLHELAVCDFNEVSREIKLIRREK
ncbi:MAG: hypothetical protein JSU57_05555 [Candidatus Heimdallarchaeota archaeon]|nr:MAG: hypothetical protein JSU57_05555 [Candidatus Heimdallarchaeota archaeon]